MYEFDDDEREGGRGRVVAMVVVLLAAGGWFFVRPALSDGGDARSGGGLAFDATTSSTTTTTTSSTITTTTTTIPTTTAAPVITTIASTATDVPTTSLAPTTAPPGTVVVTTEPPAAPFGTSPDGSPLPVEIQFSSSQVVLAGTVPSQAAADRLIVLAASLTLTPVTVVSDLTINPAVPDTVAVRVVERNAVVFNEGSSNIHAEHARQLDRFVVVLNTYPDATVVITAHSDQRNDAERNQAISDQRAQSVAAFFASRGIDPARVSAAGVGESEPLTLEENDEAYAVNRRVDFTFAGLLSG